MSEFWTSERIVVASTLAVNLLGLVGCGNSTEDDVNHYIQNAPSPHSQNASIPEDKVLPPDAGVQFPGGAVEYQAPPEVAEKTGLYAITAFCGNPIDKRDMHNLYASMTVRLEDGQTEVMAGIAAAEVCVDGIINEADRPQL